MHFNESKPIYIQIADYVSDNIISRKWKEGDRVPSVRELGSELEVNPNTVMRSFEWLTDRDIIFNKRGIGFFVNEGAYKIIIANCKNHLMDNDLHDIAQSMIQIDVSLEQINSKLKAHLEALKLK